MGGGKGGGGAVEHHWSTYLILAVLTVLVILAALAVVTPQSRTPGRIDSYVVRARETLPNTTRKEGSRA